MNISYEGIGEWCATFGCEDVSEGAVVKAADSNAVAACGADEAFCGVVRALARDKKACSVQLGGLAKVKYSGSAPALGLRRLCADGTGGVKETSTGGAEYFVLSADSAAEKIVIKL